MNLHILTMKPYRFPLSLRTFSSIDPALISIYYIGLNYFYNSGLNSFYLSGLNSFYRTAGISISL